MEPTHKYPILNLIEHVSASPRWFRNCIPDEAKPRAIYVRTPYENPVDGLRSIGNPIDLTKGEWFLDTRYRLHSDFDFNEVVKDLPDNKVTVFKVRPWPTDRPNQEHYRSTFPEDEHSWHGGLYYAGPEFLRMLRALPSRKDELFKKHLVFSETFATNRRYKYPVVILSSKWDEHDAGALKDYFLDLYEEFGLDVHIMSPGLSIRDSHKEVLKSFKSPVLVVDPDFQPNGNQSLLYELKGEEDQYVHLWWTNNRVNGAVYGHGSPKLMSMKALDFDRPGEDMTTNCARHGITIHETVVGTHRFEINDEMLWRTTYREVAKLKAARTEESEALLKKWVVSDYSPTYVDAVNAALRGSNVNINDYHALHNLFLKGK